MNTEEISRLIKNETRLGKIIYSEASKVDTIITRQCSTISCINKVNNVFYRYGLKHAIADEVYVFVHNYHYES